MWIYVVNIFNYSLQGHLFAQSHVMSVTVQLSSFSSPFFKDNQTPDVAIMLSNPQGKVPSAADKGLLEPHGPELLSI